MPRMSTNLFLLRRRIMVGECLMMALAWATLVVHAQQNDVRLNFGRSTNYTDLRQRIWQADPYTNYANFGKADGVKCAGDPIGTYFDPVYCTYRVFSPGTTNNMPYLMNLSVPRPGQYLVRLHFSETKFADPRKRIFGVKVENKVIASAIDLAALGAYYSPYVLTVNVTAITSVAVELVEVKEKPFICGIEMIYQAPVPAPVAVPLPVPIPVPLPVPVLSPVATPVAVPMSPPVNPPIADSPAPVAPISYAVRYNYGSLGAWTDPAGIIWGKDPLSYGGRKSIDCTAAPISGTDLDNLYCFTKFFSAANAGVSPYLITVPLDFVGNYLVRLHFSEVHFTAVNQRIFNVRVQGQLIASRLDIVAAAGVNAAYIVQATVTVNSEAVITLEPIVQNPTISAAEFIYVGPAAPIPPISVPITMPAPAPIAAPIPRPVATPSTPSLFQDLLINCGGTTAILEAAGVRTWKADQYFNNTGAVYNTNAGAEISNTLDDRVYRSERFGNFQYEIPVPPGNYEIIIHLAENFFNGTSQRVFTLVVEDKIFPDIDIFAIGGYRTAFTITVAKIVDDGFVSIRGISRIKSAKISGIEIVLKEIHTAHAVSQGPYTVVDKDSDGFGSVTVDASASHTHGPGLFLNSWIWKMGASVVGTGEVTTLRLPVGVYDVTLTVTDSGMHESSEVTSITILPFGYPDVESLSPAWGNVFGGYEVTIMGSGFSSASELIVHFGLTDMTGNDIQVVNDTTISVFAPYQTVAVPVQVSVESIPLNARSNSITFTYETAVPILWTSKQITGFPSVTVAAFSPDGKLFAASSQGQIARISLDNDFNVVSAVVALVAPNRAILGMAFDPMTSADSADPWVYFSSSALFHGGSQSSSGAAINGKIQRARGADLEIVEDIVTGLPVADMDHAVNGIEFGDEGEIYFQIGSNTNGGIPGPLTGNQIQKENYFSAATNVAYLADANFNGNIQYDKADDGVPTTIGVEPFAYGERNPFGICLHSNGYLYGTDNGPNFGYGPMKTGCGANEFVADIETEDKINVLLPGRYYGHPNPLRASAFNEPRQCKWRSPTEPSDADFTAPLVIAPSSTGAIIEFQSDHFGGQMRGNLIYSKYTSKLHRVILRADGLGVIPLSNPPIGLVGAKGLGVTQAPDGSLVEVQYSLNELWVHKPNEAPTSAVKVNTVFPRRGALAGGTTLTVYGKNFQQSGKTTTVTVGASPCPVISLSPDAVTCTLPGGSGTVDVTVTVGTESYTFVKGYRFITGHR